MKNIIAAPYVPLVESGVAGSLSEAQFDQRWSNGRDERERQRQERQRDEWRRPWGSEFGIGNQTTQLLEVTLAPCSLHAAPLIHSTRAALVELGFRWCNFCTSKGNETSGRGEQWPCFYQKNFILYTMIQLNYLVLLDTMMGLDTMFGSNRLDLLWHNITTIYFACIMVQSKPVYTFKFWTAERSSGRD